MFTREEMCEEIYKSLLLNANTLNFRECYVKCANKYKLPILLKAENQVVMGRRGTGKTTIFKAFTYYVNKVYDNPKYRAWYISIDECLPSSIELRTEEIDDIVLHVLKNFLGKFLDFLYHDLEMIIKMQKLDKRDLSELEDRILELVELINYGNAEISVNTLKVKHLENTDTEKEMSGDITLKRITGKLKGVKINKGSQTVEKTQEYLFKLKIDEIRQQILDIFKLMKYEKVFFCIDEFNLIDRRTTISIQAKFAQILKQLFFGNNCIVIKIANVWNESRMQSRQFGGHIGIEMDQDIFQRHELNLDIMFDYHDEKAIIFFKDMLVNNLWYQKEETELSDEARGYWQEKIVNDLFNKRAFEHLVCGSMGIPRVFGTILADCLGKLRDTNYSEKISVTFICDGIIDHYNKKVRQGIPYSSRICSLIDDYVTEKKRRFFLVKIRDYNKGVHYFDGLVAKIALHQYPSEYGPRKLKNTHKIYLVHYGNYLESIKMDPLKLFNEEIVNEKIYPDFPKDIDANIGEYSLQFSDEDFEEIYCTSCLRYYNRNECHKENYTYICPECGEMIDHWY